MKRRDFLSFAAAAALGAPRTGGAVQGTAPLDIGSRRQLFLDDHVLVRTVDLERVFHPARKEPRPVLEPDRPWEQGERGSFLGVLGNCVFFDEADRRFRMYYLAYQVHANLSETLHVCVATSTDGLRWDKPELGVADYRGSKRNNLLFDYAGGRRARDWWTYNNVVRDEHDPDPRRRYKALGQGTIGPAKRMGVIVAWSADGYRWTEPAENPVLPNSDTHTLLGWDERVGKYVAYPRTEIRSIGYATSDDFVHWTKAETVLRPEPGDPAHYQIYGMPVFRYEDLYLGLPWAFIAADSEPLDTQLVVSRDGRRWRRVAGQAMFVPRGEPGTYDDCYAIAAAPIQVGDELLFYYMGAGFPHGAQYARETRRHGAIGLARAQLDRFQSLACRYDGGGTALTRPFRFAGGSMTVNCACLHGRLRVELQDDSGMPLPGFAEADCDDIRADALRHRVTWRGRSGVAGLAGRAIRARFTLADGELFGFGFA